jgi:hypothetical protein
VDSRSSLLALTCFATLTSPTGCGEPGTTAAAHSSSLRELSREEYVSRAIVARTRNLEDIEVEDRFAALPTPDRAFDELVDWADRNMRSSDVVGAPPCEPRASSAHRGRRCCITSGIKRLTARSVIGQQGETVIPILLIGEAWENPAARHSRVCGIVATIVKDKSGEVPFVVGFAL